MKYRKKPIIVDAFKWWPKVMEEHYPDWIYQAIERKEVYFSNDPLPDSKMIIKTLKGDMSANHEDYIIRGIKGEIYPCKPDIFEAIYELVEGQ